MEQFGYPPQFPEPKEESAKDAEEDALLKDKSKGINLYIKVYLIQFHLPNE